MQQEYGDFDSQLHALSDDARRQEAIAARRRKSDRQVAAGLSSTFAGTLTELAETGSIVTVVTRTGGTIRGQITALGPEIVVVRASDQASVILRTAGIEGLRERGAGHDRGVDAINSGADLALILDTYAQERHRVSITLASGNHMMGRVDRVGMDQLVITLDGDGESMTVPLSAIDQVVIGT